MFNQLASFINRWAAAVLVAAAIFVAIAAVFGSRAFGALSGGGFHDPLLRAARPQTRLEIIGLRGTGGPPAPLR